MRALDRALAIALVLGVLVLGAIPFVHAHDTGSPGVSDADCPLVELGGQTAALSPSPPIAAGFDLHTSITPLPDHPGPGLSAAPASPRAPPHR